MRAPPWVARGAGPAAHFPTPIAVLVAGLLAALGTVCPGVLPGAEDPPAPAAAPPAAPRIFAVGTTGMALSAPPDWTAIRDSDGAQLVLRAPPPTAVADPGERARACAAVSVAVQELRAAESPEAFARRCRADLEHLLTALTVTGQEPVTLGGRIWTRISYHFQFGKFTWQQELYATAIDGTGYCVTCSCSASEYARWQAAFAAVLASLERSRPALDRP